MADPDLKNCVNENREVVLGIQPKRVLKFSIVGGIGMIINVGVLYILTDLLHLYYIISSILAIEISIFSNFMLNNYWTWGDRPGRTFFQKIWKYHVSVGITAIFANWLLLIVLTEVFEIYYLLSNLIGIGVGTIFNFILNDLWTFR